MSDEVIYNGRKMSLEDAMDLYEAENAGKGWEEEVQEPGPNDVIFTQYLRPNGRRQSVWLTVPPESKMKANVLVAAGYAFECEELRTGMVHLDCCNAERQLALKLIPNGPEVPQAVISLIDSAYEAYQRIGEYPMEEA